MRPWLFLILCLAWHAVGLPKPDEINIEALKEFADSMRKSQPGPFQPQRPPDDAPGNAPQGTPGDTGDTPDNRPNGNDIGSNPVNWTLDLGAKTENGFISAAYFVNWVRSFLSPLSPMTYIPTNQN